ncbi:MAG TPA: response regulator [Flavobacterium sp.]|jgi:CheY-like chemotaxis protein
MSTVKIILTDDDADDRIIFKDAFHELHLDNNLQMFNDGVDLMEYLKTTDEKLPELVLLDLNMPRKSGYECLKEIRANEKLKDLSVAIYSTSSSQEDIEQTFANGADLYITKPNDYANLKRLIKEVMQTNWNLSPPCRNREKFFLKF